MARRGGKDAREPLAVLSALVTALSGLAAALFVVCTIFCWNPPVSLEEAIRLGPASFARYDRLTGQIFGGIFVGFLLGSLSGYGYVRALCRRRPPSIEGPQAGDWPPRRK